MRQQLQKPNTNKYFSLNLKPKNTNCVKSVTHKSKDETLM